MIVAEGDPGIINREQEMINRRDKKTVQKAFALCFAVGPVHLDW